VSGDANTSPAPESGAVSIEGGAGGTTTTAEPTSTVGHGEQTQARPAGSAKPEGGVPIQERPEAQVGAAFAGGLLVALILKRLGN
jgi:hypothetical protein